MANEVNLRNELDLRSVWQSQEPEGAKISLEEIQQKARTLHSRVSRRNLREYVAVAIVVLAGAFFIARIHSAVVRVGSALQIAGALYVAYQLHRRGSAKSLPEDCGFECCVDFHRRELERQRDALRSVWWWYLGPLIPGLVVLVAGKEFFRPAGEPHHWIGFAVMIAICTLLFAGIGKLNHMAARWLQKQIDELNAAAGQR